MSAHGNGHSDKYYIKIWALLLFFLTISIIGPMFEILWLTIATAFGIALVKATMVASYFMHLNVEKRFVWYLLILSVVLLAVFYFGVAADVMNKQGTNWIDCVSTKTCAPLR